MSVLIGASFLACASDSDSVEDGPTGGSASGGLGGRGVTGGTSGAEGGTSAGGQSGTSSGGTAGNAGTGAMPTGGASGTGPCQGLECDKPTCTMGQCTQMPCPAGTDTSVSGRVWDPAGRVPIYNALVYVPNGPLPPLVSGASCSRCDQSSFFPVASTLTDDFGNFAVRDMPVGSDIPLVIQIGKWRRQITIPNVPRCVDTALTDREQTSLPSKKIEGDLPLIAITTGGGDPMECLVRRIGVEDMEFTTDAGNGRVHLFAGSDGTAADPEISTKQLDGGEPLPHADTLWSTASSLRRYDVVIFSCEGDSQENQRPAGARQAVFDYTTMGGRVLASHWHHRWISLGPAPMPDVAAFVDRDNPNAQVTGTINMDFPKGQALGRWLVNVGGSTMLGEITVLEARDNVQAVNTMYATEWLRVINETLMDTPSIQFFTFNTPLTAPENQKCGRVVFNNLHVTSGDMGFPADNPGQPFPSHCAVRDLSAQEKVLEFLLFDLSCVQDDRLVPGRPYP